MRKPSQVVMLSTNEKASLKLGQNGLLVNNTFGYDSHFTNQHLYILSDEEIKEGDWCYGMDGIFQYKGKINLPDIELPKKIIATTNKSIFLPDRFPSFIYLPQPSQSFIEKFVEEYNKGNVITEVMVEYESIGAYANPKYDSDYQLKINSDNTINISMPKDSWSREEVRQKLNDYRLYAKNSNLRIVLFDRWIEENL